MYISYKIIQRKLFVTDNGHFIINIYKGVIRTVRTMRTVRYSEDSENSEDSEVQ